MEEYAQWVAADDGGRVGLVSLELNRGAEVNIELPGPSHQRLDHEKLNFELKLELSPLCPLS